MAQVSLHTVETLSGLLRAANTLEPELAHSALSLLVTLTSTDQGKNCACRENRACSRPEVRTGGL